ncbi:unnamed protein product [Jaminaea pallidilutea]
MTRVSAEEFVARLSSLYEASSASGSVYVSSKRATHPTDSNGLNNGDIDMSSRGAGSSSSTGASPSAIIFRVTNGHSKSSSRVKLSTLVTPSDLDKFHEALQPVMRQHLGACLRKRDKAKERKVDKDLAARKKKDEELGGWTRVAKLGSKRGAGHRQRQRAQRRALRLRAQEKDTRKKAAAAGLSVPSTEAKMEVDGPSGGAQAGKVAQNAGGSGAAAGGSGGGGGGQKKKKKGKK